MGLALDETLQSILTLVSNLLGGAASAAVTDAGLSLASAADVDCTSAAHLTTETGSGYIIVTNRDPSATVYLGKSNSVSGATNGEALLAGTTRSWKSADLTKEYGIGSATVNVSVRK